MNTQPVDVDKLAFLKRLRSPAHDAQLARKLERGEYIGEAGSPLYKAVHAAYERHVARGLGQHVLAETLIKQAQEATPVPNTDDEARRRMAAKGMTRMSGRPVFAPSPAPDIDPGLSYGFAGPGPAMMGNTHVIGNEPVPPSIADRMRATGADRESLARSARAKLAVTERATVGSNATPFGTPLVTDSDGPASPTLRALKALALLEARKRAAKKGRAVTYEDVEKSANLVMRAAIENDEPDAVKAASDLAKSVAPVRKVSARQTARGMSIADWTALYPFSE